METPDASSDDGALDCVFQLAAAQRNGTAICFAARASGLYRSRDEGVTWESAYASLQSRERLPTTAVVLGPDFEHEPVVFAGLNGAILCSYDGGDKWQRGRLPNPLPAVSTLLISPNYAEDGTVFAGTSEDGVLVSRDRGRSWAGWNFGLIDLQVLCLAISPSFAVDETIFAGTASGVFRSTNGGRAWREVPLPIQPDAILSLGMSACFAQDLTIYVGTENCGLLASRDGGRQWQLTSRATCEAPVNQILVTGGQRANKLGILWGDALQRSVDGGTTWVPWKARQAGNCGVTAAAVMGLVRPRLLLGLADGRIVRA